MITPDMKQSGDNDVNIYLIGGDPGGGGICTCFMIWVFKCEETKNWENQRC